MPLTARQRSILNKNGAKRSASIKGKRGRKASEGDYLYVSAPTDLKSIAYPGGAMALSLILTARLASAFWNHIADCDETYNYWEPLHYLVYGKGLQTWEYSPEYALRSYFPLWLFAIPAKILSLVMSPVSVFYSLRVILAVLTSFAELMFYKAVCYEFGVHVGRVWLGLMVPAAGVFAASTAMLPSSWSSILVTAAFACWWRRRYPGAIMFIAATTILSWPFTALLGFPIALDMLVLKRQFYEFFKWSTIALIVFLVPTVLVDTWHYGRFVVTPWNIVAYNIFTEHGPDLYGVEPWSYYFINGLLNFNFVWVLALNFPIVLGACRGLAPLTNLRAPFCAPYWLSFMPLALWLLVFMLQPHKEERFLYPVYSAIVLAGAAGLDCVQKLIFGIGKDLVGWREREGKHYLYHTLSLVYITIAVAATISLSRGLALHHHYSAPMYLLKSARGAGPVCFGKEWHRSPSHFHLEQPMRFVRSDFQGQMPAPYDPGPNATRIIHPYFNDQNQADYSTYLRPSQCQYLVDSDLGTPSALEPLYHTQTDKWEVVTSQPILDAPKSYRIFRAFYVPWLTSGHVVYGNLYLLKNKAFV